MKLLFDENLSPKLVVRLAEEFPNTIHVSRAGFEKADDTAVWNFAKTESLTIVTKDADVQGISL